jgi:murein DD-endopeptidase MepM/ murein hydrolase activator NlpD
MLVCRSGRSAARLARLVRDQEVGGSTPLAPTIIFSLILLIVVSSCTPAPKYRAHAEESAQAPLWSTGAPADSTVRALMLTAPVHAFAARRVTSPFGIRQNPRTGGTAFHEGVDIKAQSAEEIIAAGGGTVTFSGKQRGYGNVVKIDHGNGVSTVYAHLFYASVRKGERVSRGQRIGHAGKRGTATGVHLHFEIRHHGRALDPMQHLWLDSKAR